MKKSIGYIFISLLLFTTILLMFPVYADTPPLPPSEQGQGGNQPPGGGAPIGEGILFLSLMASAWAMKKYRNAGAQD